MECLAKITGNIQKWATWDKGVKGVSVQEGKFKLTFVDGEIIGVSVNASLDLTYKRLFEAAQSQLRTGMTVDAGVQLIIFGCFWLEAECNSTLRDTLEAAISHKKLADVLWNANKRASFLDKLAILMPFSDAAEQVRTKKLHQDLKQLFDLRNRLAHFKDNDTVIANAFKIEDLVANSFPDAELITRLTQPAVLSNIQTILDGIGWLSSIRAVHFSSTVTEVRMK